MVGRRSASSPGAWAVEEERLEIETLPPEPDLMEELEEAEVTIIQQENRIIEEYRLDGHLRAIRVIPAKGRPYFLIDTDGDPDQVDLPIPGNDDSIRSIELISSLLADAVLAGKEKAGQRKQEATEGAGA